MGSTIQRRLALAGTAVRHGAKSVTNFELMPEPPEGRAEDNPWPQVSPQS